MDEIETIVVNQKDRPVKENSAEPHENQEEQELKDSDFSDMNEKDPNENQ